MKKFIYQNVVFKGKWKPLEILEMEKLYDKFFIDLIMKLEINETIESDFRIIKRIK